MEINKEIYNKRLKFYLNHSLNDIIYKNKHYTLNKNEIKIVKNRKYIRFFDLKTLNNEIIVKEKSKNILNYYLILLKNKIKEIKEILVNKKLIHNYFILFVGDIYRIEKIIGLTKTRNNKDKHLVLLRCLNYNRHWNLFYNLRDKKLRIEDFNKKKPILIWRGTTTGLKNIRKDRLVIMEKYFNQYPNIDVGYTHICENDLNKVLKERLKKYILGYKSIDEFLDYKYILSLEGNDKDSGLNWKLASNSLVFMARPTIDSWLMESTLIPNYHYIVLKDDYSDVLEKIDWCNQNPTKCIEIIKNANNYMSQFKNKNYEDLLEKNILFLYLKYLKFEKI